MSWWPRRESHRHEPELDGSPEDGLGERLSAYLDDELTPTERAEVEGELTTSQEARELLEDLRMVRAALASLEVVRAPRSFALEAPPARSRAGLFSRLELGMRVGTALAAFAFVVVVAGGGSLSVTAPITPAGMAETRATALSAPDASFGVAAADEDRAPEQAPPPVPADAPAPADAPPADRDAVDPAERDRPEAAPAVGPEAADEATFAEDAGEPEQEALRAPGEPTAPLALTDSPGGPAAALGVVAILLGALSWLVARARRSANASS